MDKTYYKKLAEHRYLLWLDCMVDFNNSRTASAAWKASNRKWRKRCKKYEHLALQYHESYIEQHKLRKAAEKRVQELEGALNEIMDKSHERQNENGFVIYTIASIALNK